MNRDLCRRNSAINTRGENIADMFGGGGGENVLRLGLKESKEGFFRRGVYNPT